MVLGEMGRAFERRGDELRKRAREPLVSRAFGVERAATPNRTDVFQAFLW
jgi:hypothetical protein